MKEINLELLQKFLDHRASASECEVVNHWFETNNLNKDDIVLILNNPDRIKLFEKINSQEDWEKVRIKLEPQRKIIPLKYLIRIAASIAVIVGLTGTIIQFYKYFNHPMVVYNYSNNILNVMLPDSSWVSLYRNSKLVFGSSFTDNREVTVEGRLFFEVKRNIQKPFVVKTTESSIKVLGTSFLVSTDKQNTKVIVNSGKVAFYSTRKQCDTLLLTKGTMGLYNSDNACLAKQENDDINFISWKNHNLSFNNTSINKVIPDLEEYFSLKVIVLDPEIYKLSYTSEFKNPTIHEVMKEMELVLNVDTKIIGRNLILDTK